MPDPGPDGETASGAWWSPTQTQPGPLAREEEKMSAVRMPTDRQAAAQGATLQREFFLSRTTLAPWFPGTLWLPYNPTRRAGLADRRFDL